MITSMPLPFTMSDGDAVALEMEAAGLLDELPNELRKPFCKSCMLA